MFMCLTPILILIAALFVSTPAHARKMHELLTYEADSFPTYLKGDDRKIITIGDTHGDIDAAIAILRYLDGIDAQGEIARDTRIVFMGDESGKGFSTLYMRNFILNLMENAEEYNSEVVVIEGNHEGWQKYGHIADIMKPKVPPTDRKFFIDAFSENPDEPVTPLDAVLRSNFDPSSPYFSLMMDRNIGTVIGRVLFIHGGIGDFIEYLSLGAINATYRRMNRELAMEWMRSVQGKPTTDKGRFLDFKNRVKQLLAGPGGWLLTSTESPLNTRDLSYESIRAKDLEAWMRRLEIDKVVVGHTPTFEEGSKGEPPTTKANAVQRETYGGRVIRVDTGIGSFYGGGLSALVFRSGDYISVNNIKRPSGPHPLREKLGKSPPARLCRNMPFLVKS